MANKKTFHRKLSRRGLFKVGAAGTAAYGLSKLTGCAPGEEQEPEPEPENDVEATAETARKGFMDPVESPWYAEKEEDRVGCTLCPWQCELEKGERGQCRVRENRDGRLYTLSYGNPALVQMDPVERKPFFHVHPGSRALSISTAGCNLACDFCEVWDMALVKPEEVYAYNMPPGKVIEHAKGAGVKSISYAFGEPAIFYEYMKETAALAREEGFLNLLHTAGYLQPEPLEEIVGYLDAVNLDLKSINPEFYREYVGGEIEPVLRTLRFLKEKGIHIEITNIVIPTLNDDAESIGEMCSWIVSELGPDIPLHFARFYPLYKLSGLPRTPVSTLDNARDTALEAGLKYVYVARVTGHEGENTFCPECGEKIIPRKGFVIEDVKIENGACSYCGASIPGRWS